MYNSFHFLCSGVKWWGGGGGRNYTGKIIVKKEETIMGVEKNKRSKTETTGL
jgi:hypothetical protein